MIHYNGEISVPYRLVPNSISGYHSELVVCIEVKLYEGQVLK